MSAGRRGGGSGGGPGGGDDRESWSFRRATDPRKGPVRPRRSRAAQPQKPTAKKPVRARISKPRAAKRKRPKNTPTRARRATGTSAVGTLFKALFAPRPGTPRATPPKARSKNTRAAAKPTKPRKAPNTSRRATTDRRGGRLAYGSAVAALWGAILFAGVIGYYALTLPDTSGLWQAERTPAVTLVAANGQVLTRRGDMFAGNLSLYQVPQYFVDAVLATEDQYFYYHFGIDPLGLARAMLANIKAGALVQGGSTITQQLAKNVFLKPDRTWERKFQELILALWLEARFSKDQILTLYINRVYFGAGAYGLEAAAQRYFNKSAGNLSLSEAAMLAGLLKAPSRYSPTRDLGLAQDRAATVLARMVKAGYLTRAEGQSAFDRPASLAGYGGSGSINYFVDWVVDDVATYAERPDVDLTLSTTIDPFMQRKAEAVVEEALARDGDKLNVSQAAMVVLSADGAVRAMVGGRSYARSQFNRATQAQRQPGSAFKPMVYLTAMEKGLEPGTMRIDQPITIDGWSPSNYADDYAGPVTLSEALAQSINTVTVQVSEEVGRQNVIHTARRLGIRSAMAPRPSLALGTFETSLMELTASYAAFANGGYGVLPHGIEKVSSADDELLYERQGSGPGRVVGPRALGAMNHMLSRVMTEGTGRKAALAGLPAAGKTGTSQGFRDAWFVGYTADLIVGVWVGNDDGSSMNKVTGGGLPAVMWRDFMFRTGQADKVAALPGLHKGDQDVTGWIDPNRREWEEPGFFERLFGLSSKPARTPQRRSLSKNGGY